MSTPMLTAQLVGPTGTALPPDPGPQAYTLLANANAIGPGQGVTGIRGGDYLWRVEGTFSGVTATLQVLGLDGTTWSNLKDSGGADVAFTASGVGAFQRGIGAAQGAALRVAVTGSPTGAVLLNSTIGGLG
ncbi:hypothetical protein [uncultured Methylobacterium sp.]|jgi:hypothetical protein|uniref:hypothetical protein n=1 Tax=uncultured Methylobacterium sp. TaxID=157278 RepID=UPI0026022AA0|nr:hypothetical protein [uncultured Methylobacterium sp.]